MSWAPYIIVLSLSCGVLAVSLEQNQLSITIKESGRIPRIRCKILPKGAVNTQKIHWYQQKDGESLKRLLYSTGSSSEYDQDSYKNKFSVDSNDKDECIFSVRKPEKNDNGKYYCASWDYSSYDFKVFGSGTKLVVTDTPLTKPTVTVFPPSSKSGQVTLVCLAEKYFPDVIKIEWKKNNEIVPAMAQLEKDKAAIVLKVTDDVKLLNDRYSCQVTHEALPNGHYEEDLTKIKAQPGKKETGPVNAATCRPDTISLSPFNMDTFAYTLLILKSVMYFGIISVLTYKIKSAQALGVKKRVP